MQGGGSGFEAGLCGMSWAKKTKRKISPPIMNQIFTCFLFCLCSLQAATIAPTDALSPEEQQKKFKIPKGFVIELVVAEPDIGQPMNLNFDARGRLWVSSSVEYPYPAKGDIDEPSGKFKKVSDHPPGDWLTVVSGLDKSDKVQTIKRFVGGLNIPIGTVPLNVAVCWPMIFPVSGGIRIQMVMRWLTKTALSTHASVTATRMACRAASHAG